MASFRNASNETNQGFTYGIELQNTASTVDNFFQINNIDSTGTVNSWMSFVNKAHSSGTPQGQIDFATRNGGNYGVKMSIDKDGKVGIGTTAPTALLHIYDSGARAADKDVLILKRNYADVIDGDKFSISFTNQGDAVLGKISSIIENGVGGLYGLGFSTYNAGSTAERVRITSNGKVGIGTTTPTLALEVLGSTSWPLRLRNTAAGGGTNWNIGPNTSNNFVVLNQAAVGVQLTDGATAWSVYSDRRLKENIKPVTDGLDRILKVKPSHFDWKNRDKNKHDVGFIAQELKTAIPEAVVGSEADWTNGKYAPMGIMTDKLAPFIVKAIQEQQAIIEKLEKRIAELESR